MNTQILHYREQRDKLIVYLMEKGAKYSDIARILGISRQAISLQFKSKKKDKNHG